MSLTVRSVTFNERMTSFASVYTYNEWLLCSGHLIIWLMCSYSACNKDCWRWFTPASERQCGDDYSWNKVFTSLRHNFPVNYRHSDNAPHAHAFSRPLTFVSKSTVTSDCPKFVIISPNLVILASFNHFTSAMPDSAVVAVATCLSVRPSYWWIVSRRLKISSNLFRGPVAPWF